MTSAPDSPGRTRPLTADRPRPWYREVPRSGWRALAAAGLGWLFEVFDVYLLSLTIPALVTDFGLTKAQAGLIGTVSAIGLIIGGILGGGIADRIGRVRTLSCAMVVYAVFTGCTALAGSVLWVELLRLLAGLGMGASWSAGAALVAETWPAAHRGKGGALMQAGMPVGNLLAIMAAAAVAAGHGGLAHGGWRVLYALGAVPALAAVWVRLRATEPATWRPVPRMRLGGQVRGLFAPGCRRPLLLALTFVFFAQYVFWAVSTFLPTYLVEVDHIAFTHSLRFLVVQQLGALVGFACFGALADRWGRRPTFLAYLLVGATAIVLLVTTRAPLVASAAAFLAGVGISGTFAGMGPWAAEMMHRSPTRGLAMGTIYNGGRVGGAIAPYLVGSIAATSFPLGLATAALACALAMVTVLATPETRGRALLP